MLTDDPGPADPHADDVDLAWARVSNMELADDRKLVSTSALGAQDTLNQFADSEYTANTFVLTNIPKTLALVFGPCPTP
ncbi:hypothetical protein LXA43DRAFT_367004 [Ganoderma leucocontextum]|nr:hypothetical protein LXA43DRAFT_367004 [Ganoderma leucocontextum]